MTEERRNAENLSEAVPVSARALQRFLTDARWEDEATGFGPDGDRSRYPARAAEPAPTVAARPSPIRPSVNSPAAAKSVDLDLPPFLQQKNRPQA